MFDRDKLGYPVVARSEDCTSCLLCELHCPDFAIEVQRRARKTPAKGAAATPEAIADAESDRVKAALAARPDNDERPVTRQRVRRPRRGGRLTWPPSPILMQGNEAVAEGAIAAGARFFAGYPITPSTEIAETLARRMPEVGGSFIQMEDEIASIAAVCGASLAGQKALTATSGPGFSLMQEMIGFAEMAQIPCVIVDVMRGGPSTGLPTEPSQGDVMQARWGTHGEHSVIALVPSSVLECYTLTVEAFNLAEQYRTPVIVLSDALIGHMREAVTLPEPGSLRIAERGTPDCAPEEYDTVMQRPRQHPAAAAAGLALPRARHGPRLQPQERRPRDRRPRRSPATWGATCARRSTTTATPSRASRSTRWRTPRWPSSPTAPWRARPRPSSSGRAPSGVPVGLVRPITLWPFPTLAVDRMAEQVRTVIVPEMNIKQMSWEVQAAVAGRAKVVDFGRVDGKLITPAQIEELVKNEFYYHDWEKS